MSKNADVRSRSSAMIDLALVILFYLLALASLLTFYSYREEYPRLFMYIGCAAVAVRIIYYIKRYFLNTNK